MSVKVNLKRKRLGIIGMGYVGLPLAMEFLKAGFDVTGFEINKKRVASLKQGESHISDVPSKEVARYVKADKFHVTSEFDGLSRMGIIIICVPTPLRKTKDPDISYIYDALQKIKKTLKKGQLIILESTTYPGTTREVLFPVLKESGLKVGKDFWLAFSPERVDPGNKKYGVENTPKVVGGMTRSCTQLASQLYSYIVKKVVSVSSPETAEMVKLLENTFRAVNIGLVNEVALMCDRMNLDTWEVIDAAATKPFGFMPFYPGPGLGGHCIPLDPHYLSWKLKTLNFYARFIELAGEINSHMPEYVVRKISDGLNERGKSIKGSKVLVLGVAYKKDISDVRESPALDVIQKLKEKKAKISYHDPYVKELKVGKDRYKSVPFNATQIRKQDCVVVTTNHSVFPSRMIIRNAKLVVDTRNMSKGVKNKKVIKI